MSYEVEVKFRLDSVSGSVTRETIESKLEELLAEQNQTIRQSDRYFNHPSRDFAQTDEALRIRSVDNRNWVTFKGPRIDTETKTRKEIEMPLGDASTTAEGFAAILCELSFRPVAIVRKTRTIYQVEFQGHPVEVSIDDVDHVGTFVEVELLAEEDAVSAAQEIVLELGQKLGFTETEPRSYLELLLEAKET